jgi:hypothetical protein
VLGLASFPALPAVAQAATVANPLCPGETVSFNPGNGQDIVVPQGFKVSVFASGLNMPTGIAFIGNAYVLESGHGIPSRCNEQSAFGSGDFDPGNPFTPDILVFNQNGVKIRGPWANPRPAEADSSLQDRQSTSSSSTAFPEGSSSRRTPIRRLTRVGKTTVHALSP